MIRAAAWIVLTLVVGLALADALLAPTPVAKQPDFIDTVLASRAVVAAIRIAIVFAAGFLALSVIALVAQRRWLTRIGPVEVEETSDLNAETQRLEEELEAAHQVIKALKGDAANTHQLLEMEKGL